jgi:hypothetical protein
MLCINKVVKDLMEYYGVGFADKSPYTYTHKRKAKNIYHVLVSHRNVYFTEQYKRWYPERKKIIPEDLILTSDICKHWYYGDGYLGNSHGRINNIVLYTNGFSDIDRELLQEKLLTQLGFYSSVMNAGQIYIGKNHFMDFLSHIGDCKIPCFEYKWATESREKYDEVKKLCEGLWYSLFCMVTCSSS